MVALASCPEASWLHASTASMQMCKLISWLLQAASSSARRAALLHTKIKAVEAWLNARKLPRELRADVTSYFADTWVTSAGAEWIVTSC